MSSEHCIFLLMIYILKASGSNKSFRLEVEHRIEYDEKCPDRSTDPDTRTVRFKAAKNYINYEGKDQVGVNKATKPFAPKK